MPDLRRLVAGAVSLLFVLAGWPVLAASTPPDDQGGELGSLVADLPVDDPSDCPAPTPDAPHHAMVTGYFGFYSGDMCEALATMESVQKAGGDTYITFGYRLTERTVDENDRILDADGEIDPAFDCVEDEASCVTGARRAAGNAEIRRVLTYSGTERFGAEMLVCEELDAEIVSHGQHYQRVLLPVDGEECEANVYDVVLISNGQPGAPSDVATMMVAAEVFGIELFPGIPRPAQDPDQPWLIDTSYLDTTEAFTSRTVKDWIARYGHLNSFGGLYQSVEMPMKGNDAWDPQFALYDAQHGTIARQAPELSILVSPYIDGRPSMDSPVSAVALFTERLIASANGAHVILAPQDGRGTGKGGVYFPDEAHDVVLERLQEVVGGPLTYEEAFNGTTSHDYYTAALESGKTTGGDDFELWANIELMEPAPLDGEPICIPGVDRGQTDSARVAKQVSVAGDSVTKLIGYDWDNAMLCEVPGKKPLVEQLADDQFLPVPTGLTPEPAGTALLTGYQLEGVEGTMTWRGADGMQRSVDISPKNSEFIADFGESRPAEHPAALQALRFRLDIDDLDPDAPWVSLELDGPHGSIPYGSYSVEPDTSAAVCTETVTGAHSGGISVDSGTLCIEDATVAGPISVDGADQAVIRDSTVRGRVTIVGTPNVALRDSAVRGPIEVEGAQGSIGLQDTTVDGPLILDGTRIGPLGILAEGTHVNGSLECSQDTEIEAQDLVIRGSVEDSCTIR